MSDPHEKKRLVFLGFDGLPPETFRRFLRDGHMPKLSKRLADATIFNVIPTLPPLTAPGWASIATGAHPSTLGIENILLPTIGESPASIRNGFDATLCQAEFIWETLSKEGLNPIVIKYPGSWPPREGDFVQVDGAGGYADITCKFEAVSSRIFCGGGSEPSSGEASTVIAPSGYSDHWRIDSGGENAQSILILRAAAGWRGVPSNIEPIFEFVLHLENESIPLHGLACVKQGLFGVWFARGKKIDNSSIWLEEGSWSNWIYASAPEGRYAYRFKLIQLDNSEIQLYRSEGHLLSGYTKPHELAASLNESIGPPIEWAGTYDIMHGLIDLDTQFEIYRDHTHWIANCMREVCSEVDWDAVFLQWHLAEYAHHLVGASLHPEHPRHDSRRAEKDVAFLAQTYSLFDELVGALDDVADESTYFVLASDHGHDLVHSVFYINQFLIQKGWLCTDGDRIDWSNSVAYGIFPGFILMNRKDWWPGGVLSNSEAEELMTQISSTLRDLIDKRTNCPAIHIVVDRPGMRDYGLWGPQVPDLFVAMERGYEVATRIMIHPDAPIFEVTEPYSDVTSGHGSHLPTQASAQTIAAFSGPGIPKGTCGRSDIRVIDIAPTISKIFGIRSPAQCDGKPVDFQNTR